MRAVLLFPQVRAVIKFVLRAAITLKSTDGQKRALALCKKRNTLHQVIWLSLFSQSLRRTANRTLLNAKLRQLASRALQCGTLGGL